jgi:DNA processing protein
LAENFPKRNRIVAGICDALVIVESGIKGGAMITADLAWSYDREVFALPGKITDTYSQGCIKLINNNRAICIQNAHSLVKYLGWETKVNNATKIENENKIPLTADEKTIFKLLREKEKQIDDLHFESGMPLSMISMLLLNLEFKNLVVSKPGKIYKLKN